MTADPNILRKLRAFQERMGWLEPDEKPEADEGQSRLDTSEAAFPTANAERSHQEKDVERFAVETLP